MDHFNAMNERTIIEESSIALIREYLNRKKCKSSLEALEMEIPRTPQSICNRAELAQTLHIAPLIRKNKSQELPFNTVMEMLVWDLLKKHRTAMKEGRSRSPKRQTRPSTAKAKLHTAPETKSVRIENLDIDDVDDIYTPGEATLKPSKFYQNTTSLRDAISTNRTMTDKKPENPMSNAPPTNRPQSGKGLRQAAAQVMGRGLRTTNSMSKQKPKKASSVLEMLSASPEKVMSSHEPGTGRESPRTRTEGNEPTRVRTPDRDKTRLDKNQQRPKTGEKSKRATKKDTTVLQDLENNDSDTDLAELKCSEWLGRADKPNFKFDPVATGLGLDLGEDTKPIDLDSKKKLEKVKTKIVKQPRKINFEMNIGCPLDFETAVQLRQLVFGSSSIRGFKDEWSKQNFSFRECKDERTSRLRFGIVQKKGGPCGVLAVVQGFILKHLLFGKVGNLGSEVRQASADKLNVMDDVRTSCLAEAIIEIIWRAGGEKKGVVALLSTKQSFQPLGSYKVDGITEYVITNDCHSLESLHKMVYSSIQQFECGRGAAILLLYSAILSRGIWETIGDMDDPANTLMGAHSYCTQEMVNLLSVGVAASNVFDNRMNLDGGVILHGVCTRGEIGLLSLFEHYGSCKIGANLKTPRYPIWVVCSESHFSVLFCLDRDLISDWTSERLFHLYYYDGLAHQDEEVKLTVHTLIGDRPPPNTEDDLVPPLEHCIRTKWPDALIDWNGTEPIL